MTAQRVAQLFGVVFLLIAVLGFVAGGTSMEADPAMAPRILGLFPVNLLHNVVHLLFGVWGLAVAKSASGSVTFCKLGGVIYLVLAGLGFVVPTTFGLIPIGGNDIWLHALLGLVLVWVGFTSAVAREGSPPPPPPPPAG